MSTQLDLFNSREYLDALAAEFPRRWKTLLRKEELGELDANELRISLSNEDRPFLYRLEDIIKKSKPGTLWIHRTSPESTAPFYLPTIGRIAAIVPIDRGRKRQHRYGKLSLESKEVVRYVFSLPERLHTLQLEGCSIDLAFCARLFGRLRTLRVESPPRNCAYNPASWIHILSRMSSLTNLTLLKGCFGKEVDFEPIVYKRHPLPKLRSISLDVERHTKDDVLYFLRCLIPDSSPQSVLSTINIKIHDFKVADANILSSIISLLENKGRIRYGAPECFLSINMKKSKAKVRWTYGISDVEIEVLWDSTYLSQTEELDNHDAVLSVFKLAP